MREHGPPPPDRRVGCTGPGAPGCPGRACGHKGDLEGVSFACKATKERRVSAMVLGGREVESKGLSKPLVQEELCQELRGVERSNSGSLRFKVLLGLCNHWPFLGGGCRSSPSGRIVCGLSRLRVCGPN